jgi:molybdenum cofactor cytidylyltransferase
MPFSISANTGLENASLVLPTWKALGTRPLPAARRGDDSSPVPQAMNPTHAPPTIVVLAAGLGSRFAGAGPKLAQPLAAAGDLAASVLATTLRNAIESRLPVVVVTTAELAPIAQAQVAAHDLLIVPAAAPMRGRGMGDSIAAGVAARGDAAGWLILPADMPRVKPATLRAIAQAIETHPIAYAQHRGRRGHPVGFAAEMYSELVALTGDEGARRLIARYPAAAVDVDDVGVLIDIDTVEDLDAARSGAAPWPAQDRTQRRS